MIFSRVFKMIGDGLWLLGGIGAAADLGLDDGGPEAYEPCPRQDDSPCSAPVEGFSCPAPCSSSSPTRPSR